MQRHRRSARRSGRDENNNESDHRGCRSGVYRRLLDGANILLRAVSTKCQLALGVSKALHLEETQDDKCRTQKIAGLVCRLTESNQVQLDFRGTHTDVT
jgi:hypothetical protein